MMMLPELIAALMAVALPGHADEASVAAKPAAGPPLAQRYPANRPPVAISDSIEITEATAAINILANHTDPDNDPLELVGATASFGAVAFTREGLLAYAQEHGNERDDVIVYTVSDGRGGRTSGTIHIKLK